MEWPYMSVCLSNDGLPADNPIMKWLMKHQRRLDRRH
ncbi:hypothetical protein D918_00904 [Trichuris suis]|nr:hypothetical protein D918_00904 [Trichuris suis]